MSLESTAVFRRVMVSYLVAGGTQVAWELRPSFIDPLPWSFQLQVSTTANDDNSWTDVGAPAENACYAVDDERRLCGGKVPYLAYRVVLSTPLGDYISPAADTYGRLSKSQWLIARDIIRKETMIGVKFEDWLGYLVKRRNEGEVCPNDCVNPLTGEITNSNCSLCKGTGFVSGYFEPVEYSINVGLGASYPERDATRGMVDDQVRTGGCVYLPLCPQTSDLFIHDQSDRRFFIHKVTMTAESRGVPILADLELRVAPYDDAAYLLDRPTAY